MKASSERITSLCTSLGRHSQNKYIPSDDCQINLDELAFSIWRDDEAERNVSTQAYQLGVLKRDLIPILMLDGPLSYVALKALTAITYPPSPNADEYDKQMEILTEYKTECSFHPEVFAKVLEFCSSIIENPRAESELLNRAELAMTFIRNIAIIPSPPDVHERVFKIFDDSLLFDVIDMLKIVRFGDRAQKFARILAGIFYGCFAPYLPLKRKDKDKSSSVLAAFLEEQKNQTKSSRHGHWGGSVTIKGKGRGYTIPISVALSSKNNLPAGKHLVSRRRPVDKEYEPPPFSKVAEQAAAKIISSSNFPIVFEKAFPRTFSAYERAYTVREQMNLVEMTKFFYDFTLNYGAEPKVNPLISPYVLTFFQSMLLFWMEAPTLTIEKYTSVTAMHIICKMISSLCSFLIRVIQSDTVRITDRQTACGVVSRYAADLENFLITLLSQKNLSKKTITMLKDNIIALEELYKLYEIAERNKLVRIKQSRRDEDADPDDQANDRIEEDISNFNSDVIVSRLSRRANVLKPFFIILSNYENLDDEIADAMTKMLRRFTKKNNGLAHLFNLPYFYVIFKLWEDKKLERSRSEKIKELDAVLQEIVKKFFEGAIEDKTMFIQLISGFDVNDIVDGEAEKKRKEDELNRKLGFTQEILDILNDKPKNPDVDDSDAVEPSHEDISIPDLYDAKEPENKSNDSINNKENEVTQEKSKIIDKIVSESESDSDLNDNMSLQDLKKTRDSLNQQSSITKQDDNLNIINSSSSELENDEEQIATPKKATLRPLNENHSNDEPDNDLELEED